MFKGKIFEFDSELGYGYIVPELSKVRIRFYADDYIGEEPPALNQQVVFSVDEDRNGNHKAVNVEPPREFDLFLIVAVTFSLILLLTVTLFGYSIWIGTYYSTLNLLLVLVCYLDKRALEKGDNVTSAPSHLFLAFCGGWVAQTVCGHIWKMPKRGQIYRTFMLVAVACHGWLLSWALTPYGEIMIKHWQLIWLHNSLIIS
ncbi:hypothetical protein [Vibrio sonorensis]|uniref:hypothetical protein n=1 Tax=Vibrio sonorensis TaxID=1004316 RepID=UPI0008DADE11|nr:hypothetical protein [Vibrio sonorensis]